MALRKMCETMRATTDSGATLDVPGLCRQARPMPEAIALDVVLFDTEPHELRGATVEIRGERYRVVGDPLPVRIGRTSAVQVTAWRALFGKECILISADGGETPTPCRQLGGIKSEPIGGGMTKISSAIHVPVGVWRDGICAYVLDGIRYRIQDVNLIAADSEGALVSGEHFGG